MCNRVGRGSWDNKKAPKSGHEINMAAGSEEIAESLNKCVKNLATAAEALQKLRNETGNQISENRLTMLNRPTELEEHRKLFGLNLRLTLNLSLPRVCHRRRM